MLVQLSLGYCRLTGLDVDLAILDYCGDVGLLSELGLVVGIVEGRAFLDFVDFLGRLPFLQKSLDFEVRLPLEVFALLGQVALTLLCIQSCIRLLFLDDDIFPFPVLGLEVEAFLDD